jgi:hypothetical protein
MPAAQHRLQRSGRSRCSHPAAERSVRRTGEWIELPMNLRIAKTCGLTISPSLVRVDEVIE